MELRQIKYFLAVAELKHFRKAAEKLFISQPALSKQIQNLENSLAIKLLQRHNRKVELTEAGQYLYTHFKKSLDNIDSYVRQAKLITEGGEGNLRFGYVGSAMQDIIPNFLINIRKAYPKVIFDLEEMANQKQIEGLLNDSLDFGFARVDRVPKGISLYPIHQDSFSLVLPKNMKFKFKNSASLYQLKEHPFILFDASYSLSYFEKVMTIFDYAGFKPHVSHRTVHANTIYSLVENGFGASIIPTSLKKGYNRAVRFVELTDIPQRTTLQLLWKKNTNRKLVFNALKLSDIVQMEPSQH